MTESLPRIDTARPSLPRTATELFGRDDDLSRATRLLREEGCVEIVGPPGVGKTRLAAELAHQLSTGPRQVYWVWLQPVDEDVDLPSYIARTLGFSARMMDAEALSEALEDLDHPVVVVLDNAEHVAARLAELVRPLAEVEGVEIVVTSRHRLEIGPTVELGGLSTDDGLQIVEAFTARDVGRDDRGPLSHFVERVGGLPLALRLGAAHLDLLTPEQLADGAGVTHALAASIRRSWERLDDDARNVLAALAVFRGGATPESLAHVADCSDGEVVETLAELRRESLVEVRTVDRRRRFSLLPTLVEFVQQEIDTAPYEKRHVEWFTRWAREAADAERSITDDALSRRLAVERHNVRIAALRALRLDRVKQAAELAIALAVAARISGFADDFHVVAMKLWSGRDRVASATFFDEFANMLLDTDRVTLAGEVLDYLQGRSDSAETRMRALRGLARFNYRRGELDDAVDRASRAMEAAREVGDPYQVAKSRQTWATVKSVSPDPAGCREALERASQTFRELGARRDEAVCDYLLAWGWSSGDRPRPMRLAAERAFEVARDIGDTRLTLETRWLLGVALHEMGELQHARSVLEDNLADSRRRGTPESTRCTAEVLVNLYCELGEHRNAREMLELQGRYAGRSPDPIARFWHAALKGGLAAHEGEFARAGAEFESALARSVDHWNAGLFVWTHAHRAVVAWFMGEDDAAEAALSRAEDVARELERDAVRELHVLAGSAACLTALETEEAGRLLEPLIAFRTETDGLARRSSQCRLLARLIEENLGPWRGLYETVVEHPDRWLVTTNGNWFRTPDGTWVSLRSRARPRAMVECLVATEVADVDTILAQVWPGETMTRSSALNRVRATISMLRSQGLETIAHDDDGYRLQRVHCTVWRPCEETSSSDT